MAIIEDAVCVIIAAMNAEQTIARAIRSALRETEVSEVVVVDDGSSDDTAAAARAAGAGSSRLKVCRCPPMSARPPRATGRSRHRRRR